MLSHISAPRAPSFVQVPPPGPHYAPTGASRTATATAPTTGASRTTKPTPAAASMSFRYYQPPRAPTYSDSEDDDYSDDGTPGPNGGGSRRNANGRVGGSSNGAQGNGKRGACTHCKSLKVKCHFSPPGGGGGGGGSAGKAASNSKAPCQRCALHKLQCVVNGRKKRRAVATHEELLLKSHKQDLEIASLLRALDARLADSRVDAWLARAAELASAPGRAGGGPGAGWAGGGEPGGESGEGSGGSGAGSSSTASASAASKSEGSGSLSPSSKGSPGLPPAAYPPLALHGDAGAHGPPPRGYASHAPSPRYSAQDLLAYFPDPSVDPATASPPDIVARGLIDPVDVHGLFDIYFRLINPYFPLLDPALHTPEHLFWHSHFLFTLIVCVSTKHSPTYASRVPLYVAFARDAGARAAVAAGTPSSSSSNNSGSGSGSGNGRLFSNSFASNNLNFGFGPNSGGGGGRSRTSTSTSTATASGSVMLTSRPAAQAFLIQAAHQMPRRRFEDSRTWLFLGIALAMVQALKLDEVGLRGMPSRLPSSGSGSGSPNGSPVPSPTDPQADVAVYFEHEDGHRAPLHTAELRAHWRADAGRTWLVAYALDTSVAAQLGKPAVLAREAALARRAGSWCRAWAADDTQSAAAAGERELELEGAGVGVGVTVNTPADLVIAAQVDVARVMRRFRAEVGRLEEEDTEDEEEEEGGGDSHRRHHHHHHHHRVKTEDGGDDLCAAAATAEKRRAKDAKKVARVHTVLDCVWRCDGALRDLRAAWALRFEADALVHDSLYAYRVYSAAMANAFGRLVILFFGLQRALNDGGGSASRLGPDDPLVRQCIATAHEVIRIMLDGLYNTGLLRFSVEAHFLYVTFAAAHLISLLRPHLRPLLHPGDARHIRKRVRDLARVMAAPDVAKDEHGMAAPVTYARYLARQLKSVETREEREAGRDREAREAAGDGDGVGEGGEDAEEDGEEDLVLPRDVMTVFAPTPDPPAQAEYAYAQDVHMSGVGVDDYPNSNVGAGPHVRWSPSDLSPVTPADGGGGGGAGAGGSGGYSALDFSLEGFLQSVGSGSGSGSGPGSSPLPHPAYAQQQQQVQSHSPDVDALWWQMQMGSMGQMSPMGPMGQVGQMGQMGQMGTMGPMGPMALSGPGTSGGGGGAGAGAGVEWASPTSLSVNTNTGGPHHHHHHDGYGGGGGGGGYHGHRGY